MPNQKRDTYFAEDIEIVRERAQRIIDSQNQRVIEEEAEAICAYLNQFTEKAGMKVAEIAESQLKLE